MSAMNVSALQVVISVFSLISLFLYFYRCLVFIGCWFSVLFCPASEKKEKKKGGFNMDFVFVLMPAGFVFASVSLLPRSVTRKLHTLTKKKKKSLSRRGGKNRGKEEEKCNCISLIGQSVWLP